MKKQPHNPFTIISFTIVIGMLLCFLVMDKDTISTQEQRRLQALPNFSVQAFWDGHYQEQWEDYIMDHLPFRKGLARMKTKFEYGLGKREFQHILIGKKGMLFERLSNVNKEQVHQKVQSLKNLQEKYPKIPKEIMIVPTKEVVYPSLLPTFYQPSNQTNILHDLQKEVTKLGYQVDDTMSILTSNQKDLLYYYTDHHWTSKASYFMFTQTHEKRFLKEGKVAYEQYVVDAKFAGSQAKRSGFYSHQKDQVEIYVPKQESFVYLVTTSKDDTLKASVFDKAKACSDNSYEVFFGGNYPRLDITTNVLKNRHLLVIKDSFANAYVPFLLPYYHQITMIDPRYYQEDIDTLIKEEGINEIFVLYNYATFFQDDALDILLTN